MTDPDRHPRRRSPRGDENATARPVRLIDVAEAAGFSTATVSQALSGRGRLPESTRRRIQLVSEELGYRPNATARSLASGRTSVIGLAVSHTGGPPFPSSGFEYFIQLLGGATEVALAHGYALVLIPPAQETTTPALGVELGGAIILDPVADDPLVRSFTARGKPAVTIGRMPDDLDETAQFWVDNDAVGASRAVIRHLERAGAKRVGIIMSPPTTSYAVDCLGAYQQWCAQTGAEPRVAIARGDRSELSGFDAAVELLQRPDPPDAIFAILDQLALGARLAAEVRGIRVPDDLMLASGIDSRACGQARPAITALNLHPEQLGRDAAEMLLAQLESRLDASPHRIVPFRLMARASTVGARHQSPRPSRATASRAASSDA
jgi:DNA-binding LacI/PurR family transcriptional regulator